MSAAATDPIHDAEVMLRATTPEELLRKAYALTRRMHSTEENARDAHCEARARYLQEAEDLRAMRDLISEELLRRSGGRA